jgi:long-chain fatty acid transport protein
MESTMAVGRVGGRGGAMAHRAFTRALVLAGASLGVIGLTTAAQAGGFFLHEQSTYFQGTSFAGVAAGGPSLSAMFWNPATITQQNRGLASETDATAIFPRTEIAPRLATTGTGANITGLGGSGDISTDAFVGASYATYGWNDWLTFGVGLNAPFGLSTKSSPLWAGMFYGTESEVFSLNANPTVAVKVNDWLSIGAGVQIQYLKIKLNSAFPGSGSVPPFGPLLPNILRIDGDSWDFGFTAGLTLTPWAGTTIGFGYRSRIDHDITGDINRPAFLVPPPPVLLVVPAAFVNFEATVPLPDIATASIRQRVGEAFTLMATVEWQNWSRLGTIPVTAVPAGVLGVPTAFAFEWRDGWLFSVGGEYQWTPNMALRAGVGYERSPISDQVRSVRLPDNDRVWLSAGATYTWSDRLALELGYSHLFAARDTTINIVPGNPTFNPALGTFVGDANSQADIISVGLRYRFLPAAPAAPLITKG